MNTLFHSSLSRLALLLVCLTGSLAAQTTSFTYQGRLTDGNAAASGPYDLQFKLYDAAANGNQIGALLTRAAVNVTNGVFSTTLDFGAAAFPGAARWLEISVRPANNGAYTTLAPRQPINSTPYAIRALSAETVTGNVPATQITGTLPPSIMPPGAYIENTTTQQPASNFNISGNGTAAGTLSGNVVNATTQYNLGGQRVLSADSQRGNVFAGLSAGAANTTGTQNSFFGVNAGAANTTGRQNSFFGVNAGANTNSRYNAFFGDSAGANNTSGGANAFFGSSAGYGNTTGSGNAFFGEGAGSGNSTGESNSYFGIRAGQNSQTGQENSFFGAYAGLNNQNGFGNSYFGSGAGSSGQSSYSSFFGRNAGRLTTAASYDSFFGAEAGSANTTGRNNAFFGAYAGAVNTTGANNTFVGYSAAPLNDTGSYNTFIGYSGGFTNTSGNNNTLLGANANVFQAGLSYATAIGAGAVVDTSNTIALGRRPAPGSSGSDTVLIYSALKLGALSGGGNTQLCYVSSNTPPLGFQIVTCSSSQRYKTNVAPLQAGLQLIQRLHPVTFDWKGRNEHDLGFIAEEVAEVEPLLTFRNEKGEIEGVKYQLVSAVLVNAVKEQQAQIEAQQKQLKQQQAELAQLKQLLCTAQPQAAVCRP